MSRNARFTVVLDQASTQSVSVDYTTVSDSAVPTEDFTPTSGTLVFAPGETSKDVVVPVRATDESAQEDFTLVLSNPVGLTLGTASGMCVLPAAPPPPPPPPPPAPSAAAAVPMPGGYTYHPSFVDEFSAANGTTLADGSYTPTLGPKWTDPSLLANDALTYYNTNFAAQAPGWIQTGDAGGGVSQVPSDANHKAPTPFILDPIGSNAGVYFRVGFKIKAMTASPNLGTYNSEVFDCYFNLAGYQQDANGVYQNDYTTLYFRPRIFWTQSTYNGAWHLAAYLDTDNAQLYMNSDQVAPVAGHEYQLEVHILPTGFKLFMADLTAGTVPAEMDLNYADIGYTSPRTDQNYETSKWHLQYMWLFQGQGPQLPPAALSSNLADDPGEITFIEGGYLT